MTTGMEVLQQRAAERGIALSEQISMATFDELGLPMIVACTACEMTMALPNAVVADNGQVFCSDCGGEQ
jgi:hypothetical protein